MTSETNKTSPSALSLRGEERILLAVLAPGSNARQLSLELVQKKIDDEKFGHLFFADGVLKDLVAKVNAGKTGEFEIGQLLDATADLKFADDNLLVTVSTTPAYGGQAITRTQLREKLLQAGIDPICLIDAALIDAVGSDPVDDLVIARVVPPRNGEDTKFKMLIDVGSSLAPKIDEDGNVEMHDLQNFIHIEAGTPLMRRFPATAGIEGTNVLGESIAAIPGDEKHFSSNLEGVRVDPKDDNVLVSTVGGHPVVIDRGVRVDQVLVLTAVDLKTGNVVFDGSVDVRGDVASGFTVQAEGDVHVQGTVERACIRCDGDLVVTGGILGGRGLDDDDSTDKQSNLIEVGGLLQARYVSHCELQVKGNVEVKEYLQAVEVVAGGDILLGQDGGTGQIIAGQCHSDMSIQGNILGNETNVKTVLSAGKSGEVVTRLAELKERLEQRAAEVKKLTLVLEKIRAAEPGKVEEVVLQQEKKIENTVLARQADITEGKAQLTKLQQQLDETEPAYIRVNKQIYPNVAVTIDGVTRRFRDDVGVQYLIRQDDEIINRE